MRSLLGVLAVFLFVCPSALLADQDIWRIDRLHPDRLNFSLSTNFYGTRQSSILEANGVSSVVYLPTNLPNIDVEFFVEEGTGVSMCRYNVYTFKTLTEFEDKYHSLLPAQIQQSASKPHSRGLLAADLGGFGMRSRSLIGDFKDAMTSTGLFNFNSEEQAKTLLKTNADIDSETISEECNIQKESKNQVCTIKLDCDAGIECFKETKTADGIYNEPMQQPQCLAEFHLAARIPPEYELLRYCAKAYFFRGLDHDNMLNRAFREEWVLYLMHGKLICSMGNDVEKDRDLLGLGYSVKLAQYNNGTDYCQLTAELSEYKDADKDGEFLIAGIIGSARMDNSNNDFWSRDNPRKECQRQYWDTMRDEKGQYIVKLLVSHYCTMSRDNELLFFDLSIDPAKARQRIIENQKVQIDLNTGMLKFESTKKIGSSVRVEAQAN